MHANEANKNLVLKFIEIHYVERNTCLEIVALDDGDYLKVYQCI